VPIVVALNKIDKADANSEKIKQQLSDLDLIIEEWGGDTICVPISAKKQQGISELLENLLVLADVLELKAKIDGPAEGVAIEAKLDKTMGPLATLLIQKGTLKIGDTVVIGNTYGKVKAMFSDTGKPIKTAEPSTPVKVLGLNEVAQAGDTFKVAHDEHEAKALLEKRKSNQQESFAGGRTLSLSDFSSEVSKGGHVKELNIILKTDVQGSIEPIKGSLEQLASEKVKVRVIHSSSGSITESDVMLALASNGIIVGFNTKAEIGAQRLADLEKVSIRYYNVIYELIKDVEKAMKGMLEPTFAEVIDGQAEVRAIFDTGKKGRVAGVAIKEGKANRDSSVRVIRKGEIIFESRVSSLKRFKNDVKEATTGQECGVGVEKFSDFQIGDIFQFYRREKVS
jgi:translation initiation factor IF-2